MYTVQGYYEGCWRALDRAHRYYSVAEQQVSMLARDHPGLPLRIVGPPPGGVDGPDIVLWCDTAVINQHAPTTAQKLSRVQLAFARDVERAGLALYSQAVRALERREIERIRGWRRQLRQLAAPTPWADDPHRH